MAAERDGGGSAGSAFAIILGATLGLFGLAILARAFGLPAGWVTPGALLLAILGWGAVAVMTRSRLVTDHLVASRGVPSGLNGLATMAQWLSGVVFFGAAAVLYGMGQDGLALVLGWSAGFLLIAVLLAPYLHKSGAMTVPDFLGKRYRGAMPRLIGLLFLLIVCAAFLTAQIQVMTEIAERSFTPVVGDVLGRQSYVWLMAGVVLLMVMPGGMRSVTWTQIAQGALAIAAFLLPAIWFATSETGMPVPQIALGEVLGGLTNSEAAIGVGAGHAAAFSAGGEGDPVTGPWGFLALAFTVMTGTAALPALLQRSFAASSVSGARASTAWALLFVTLALVTIPVYAVFARAELLELFAAGGGTLAYADMPSWLLGWSGDILRICGVAPESVEIVQGACGSEKTAGLAFDDLAFVPEFLILVLPEIAGMAPIATLLILIGGFGAALSSGSGLLLAMANGLSHDLGHRLVDPDMPAGQRVVLGKIMMLIVVLGAAFFALEPGVGIGTVLAYALALAGSGLFAPLVLGVWSRRTTGPGAAAGMVAGFGVALLHILMAEGGTGWLGVHAASAGVFGVPAAFVVAMIVSRLTPAPSGDIEDFIEEMRVARDHAIASIN